MCFVPMMLGKAIGGRTGAIVGGALGGGVPGGLLASQLFTKKKSPDPLALPSSTSFGG